MPVKSGPAPRRETMGGLAKGLAIIEAFSTRDAMSVADAARASGATRAAARRCLLTLVELGYIDKDGRDFRALPRLRALGGLASKRERLAKVAQPFLDKARDETNESVSLAVLDGDDALFIARAEAEHIVSTGVKIGARLPLYCSATGRVLLSDLPEATLVERLSRTQLPRRTPQTLVDPHEIAASVRHVALSGSSISDEELELGLRALAVPVTCGGKIVGALSVSTSSSRVTRAELQERFLPIIETFAKNLGKAATNID